jgi:hypothetical protein
VDITNTITKGTGIGHITTNTNTIITTSTTTKRSDPFTAFPPPPQCSGISRYSSTLEPFIIEETTKRH